MPLEMKLNWYPRVFALAFFNLVPLLLCCLSVYKLITHQSIEIPIDVVVENTILFLIPLLLNFCVFPHFKIVITATGIERHYLIKVGSFILFEKHYFFPWNTIHSFEYIGAFLFCYLATGTLNGKKYFPALINFALTNNKKGVKEIANRLPPDKVDANVWPRIKKWEDRGLV